MGYISINNLYKDQNILLFKECYSLEKVHGTSANTSFDGDKIVTFFSGGEKHEVFIKLFDENKLLKIFQELFNVPVVIYGEAYGGKCQGMSETYGPDLKFVVFDVKVGNVWLDVPNAEEVTKKLGLEFVPYVKIKTTLKAIDKERDLYSYVAIRRGIEEPKLREGIVLRPLIEVRKNNDERVICKHKREEFMETTTKKEVSPEDLKVLEEANAIAGEWVTPMRLTHILDKIDFEEDITNTGKIIKLMVEDIHREAKGEIVESKEADRAIGMLTGKLFKQHLINKFRKQEE